MARIRYLKPDFFKDEHIKDLPYEVRIFYQGLWVQADREGRGEDRPERLKIEIMPYDDIDVEKTMELLAHPKKDTNRPYLVRYEVNGYKYYQILNWHKHQKPHHTERPSTIPPPTNEQLTVNNTIKDGYTPMGMGKGMGMEKNKATPVSKETEQLLKTVKERGFNIYQFLGKMNKSIGWLPDEVVERICQSYLKNSHKITKPWPWFVKTAYECWRAWNAEKSIQEGESYKKMPIPKELQDLIKGIG